MRLRSFGLENTGPIKLVRVEQLSDVVVFAGPNGVGKTQINNALLQLARDPRPSKNWMEVEASTDEERAKWKKPVLDTRAAQDAAQLSLILRRNQRRSKYQSSFLNFDSDRAIRNVRAYTFNWNVGDPLAEDIDWQLGLGSLDNRYNDVRHSLFRLVEGQRRKIAEDALRLQAAGTQAMTLDFPDVLEPFKDAFWQLLAPKKLIEVNTQEQQIYYDYLGRRLPLDSLSSGEREVVNIVFDFILRNPEHSIVLFDEPELHLHPELSYRLLQVLSRVGVKNQFIFSTHSPDIISASLENTVVFITPPRDDAYNQALVVHRDDETHQALSMLGQSIGIISLGKKIVLVEGEESSLDKQTYGAILKNAFPEFVLVPVGGKDTLRSFDDVRDNVLNKTIWGVDFYLLADRDAALSLGQDAFDGGSARIRAIPRYHLENYFLDENVLAGVFLPMEPSDSWLRNSGAIEQKLLEIAQSVIPYAVALNVTALIRRAAGNVSIMPKNLGGAGSVDDLVRLVMARVTSEQSRVGQVFDAAAIEMMVRREFQRLTKAVADRDPIWKVDLPGRPILNKFAASAKIQVGRLKQLYLGAANLDQTFGDIVAIFQSFREAS